MAIETLYADAHLAGDFATPANAVGNTPSTWAGVLNQNTNYTSRWSIANFVNPFTTGATITVTVVAKKGSNSGTPTIALSLYNNGTLVRQILAATSVTSTTGQSLVATFSASEATANDVEIEVAQVSAGGSPSARNSAQISTIQVSGDTTLQAKSATGGSTVTATHTTSGAGTKHTTGGSTASVASVVTGGGSNPEGGGGGYDPVAYGNHASNTAGHTVDHTLAAADNVVIAWVFADGNGVLPSDITCTYGGVAMALVSTRTQFVSRASCFILFAKDLPAAGTNSCIATVTGALTSSTIQVMSLQNAGQAVDTASLVGYSAGGNPLSIPLSVTPSNAGVPIITMGGFAFNGHNIGVGASAVQTLAGRAHIGASGGGMGYVLDAGTAGANDVSWDKWSSAGNTGRGLGVAFALMPVPVSETITGGSTVTSTHLTSGGGSKGSTNGSTSTQAHVTSGAGSKQSTGGSSAESSHLTSGSGTKQIAGGSTATHTHLVTGGGTRQGGDLSQGGGSSVVAIHALSGGGFKSSGGGATAVAESSLSGQGSKASSGGAITLAEHSLFSGGSKGAIGGAEIVTGQHTLSGGGFKNGFGGAVVIVTHTVTGGSPASGLPYIWLGSWQRKPWYIWNGVEWKAAVVKRWNGLDWEPV